MKNHRQNISKLGTCCIAALALSLALNTSGRAGQFDMHRPCVDPIVQVVRTWLKQEGHNGPHQAEVAQLPSLEASEKRSCSSLSAADSRRLTAAKQTFAAAHLRILLAEESGEGGSWKPAVSELGIHRNVDMPTPKGRFDSWLGYIDGEVYQVFAGYSYEDPLHGIVLVLYGGGAGSYEFKTPTATGPITIVSERNGVLTLKSLGGEHLAYDATEDKYVKVATPGNATYYFDVRGRSFK